MRSSRYQWLHTRYQHLRGQSVVLNFLIFIGVGLSVFGLMLGAAAIRELWLGEARFVVELWIVFWGIGAALCTVLLADLVEHVILGVRLGDEGRKEYREYLTYGRKTTGRIINAVLAVIGVVGVLTFSALIVGAYAKVTDEGVTVNGPFSLVEEHYSWDQIEGIQRSTSTRTSEGKTTRKTNYKISFKDGESYDLSAPYLNLSKRELENMMDYICFRSGVNIETVDPYPDSRNPVTELMK
ncbi:hypothetical protein [Rubritalea halochordaticola]